MSNIRVKYIDHMGNDLSICNAARISMNDEADNYSMQDNIKLLHYLARGMSSKMYDILVCKMSYISYEDALSKHISLVDVKFKSDKYIIPLNPYTLDPIETIEDYHKIPEN